MNIHLSRPGGQREGPFSLEQINRDLAAKKYSETDYWAWYEGLGEWVPLHSVPGVLPESPACAIQPPATQDATAEARGTALAAGVEGSGQATEPPEGRVSAPPPLEEQLRSGMPLSALQQMIILTTGEGPVASRSGITARMLEAITAAELAAIRQKVPRDVIGHCDFLEKIRGGGAIPDVAWRAVANLSPALVQNARAGIYHICVRSFPIENGDMVTLLLFYAKPAA